MHDLLIFIQNTSTDPGIYQFFNASGQIIYIGKAKNLKKRINSYFTRALDAKTQAMIKQVVRIETIITAHETEALILEADLIKKWKPRYNILLRDDKSYPYLCISTHQSIPRVFFHRGIKNEKKKQLDTWHGPYPSASAVREQVALIQKLFQLRTCKDTFFKNRTRPCLQYQIKRCTAPCVNRVSPSQYREQVNHTIYFLQGKNNAIIQDLTHKMDQAAQQWQYEMAAQYRDQIAQLRILQQQQILVENSADLDIIGIAKYAGHTACTVLQIRNGRLLGKHTYFPSTAHHTQLDTILSAFITQYYFNIQTKDHWPQRIFLTEKIKDKTWIEKALPLSYTLSPAMQAWKTTVIHNTIQALTHYVNEKKSVKTKLIGFEKALGIEHIHRIECFDVSHTQGSETMASCVVFGPEGSLKKEYRIYHITDITPGDDYAALYQALIRRYAHRHTTTDVLIIDGGKGQLLTAQKALAALKRTGITLLAVAKGPERKPGLETLFLNHPDHVLELRMDDPVFHLIQHVRDEAHRFAIQKHRIRRKKKSQQSILEHIPGIGPTKRQQLLKYFGGLQALMTARAQDIAKVPGIGPIIAEKIMNALHTSGK